MANSRFNIDYLSIAGENFTDLLIYFNIESNIYDFTILGEVKIAQAALTFNIENLKGQNVFISCYYEDNKRKARSEFSLTGNYVVYAIKDVSESKGFKNFTVCFCDIESLKNKTVVMSGSIQGTGRTLFEECVSKVDGFGNGSVVHTNMFNMDQMPSFNPFEMLSYVEKTSNNSVVADGKIFRKLDGSFNFVHWGRINPETGLGGLGKHIGDLQYTQSSGQNQFHNIERYMFDKVYDELDYALLNGFGVQFYCIDISSGKILQEPVNIYPQDIIGYMVEDGVLPKLPEYKGIGKNIVKVTGFQNYMRSGLYSGILQNDFSDKQIPDPPLTRADVQFLSAAYASRTIVEAICTLQHAVLEISFGFDIDIGDRITLSDRSLPRNDIGSSAYIGSEVPWILDPGKIWYVDSIKHVISKENAMSIVGCACASTSIY